MKFQKEFAVVYKKIMIFIILLILGGLISFIISVYVGWNLIHPSKYKVIAVPDEFMYDYEDVEFYDATGKVKLKGTYFYEESHFEDTQLLKDESFKDYINKDSIKLKQSFQKTVILAHGYGKNRYQLGENTFKIIREFIKKGYHVLAFDFRNSGESEGEFTSVGLFEKDDLLGAIKYLKNNGNSQIVLLGFSMGAATAILAAEESKDVSAVIADSPFSDLYGYLIKNLPIWSDLPNFPFTKMTLFAVKVFIGLDFKEVSPMKAIQNIKSCPVLLIHGTDDIHIPIQNSEELFNANKNITEFWRVDGATHLGAYGILPNEYMDTIFKFLEDVIQQPSGIG